jgi:hypothetical protein
MIKIVSNNFKKVSENQLKSIAEECRKLIDTLNSSGKRLSADKQFSGGTPKTYNNPWLCFLEESENKENIEAISTLRNALLEAVNFFQNNSNQKNVYVKTLASGPALIEQMRKMAF